MENIKISEADARHKELMAALAGIERALLLHAGIERALLLINDALRLQVVEVGPSNTQTEQEKVAAINLSKGRKVSREKPQEQHVLQGGQRVSSTSKFRGGLGTVTRFAEDGKLVAVAFDDGPELWIEACDLELIGGAI